MIINKIIFIADPLRNKDGIDINLDTIYGLLSGIFNRITDIPIRLFSLEELKMINNEIYKFYNIKPELVTNVNKAQFGSIDPYKWAELCFSEPNEQTLELVKHYFDNSLVICHEPSYLLKKCFNQLNIPFVESTYHSVRYLDDIMFGITSSVDSIYNKLKLYEANKELFYYYADLLRAETYHKNTIYDNKVLQPSAIFFAQTATDRSLLDFKNKKIVSFFDYKENFSKLTKEYEIVYYKSHPFYKNEEVIKYLHSFPNVKIIGNDYNAYNLLCYLNIKKCVAISSGVINEARYFGKNTEYYLGAPYIYSDEIEDKSKLDKKIHYIAIRKDYQTASFWSDILSDIIETKKVPKIDISNVSNKYRRIIGSSWGFIDNDSQYINTYITKHSTKKKIPIEILTNIIPIKNIRRKIRQKIRQS